MSGPAEQPPALSPCPSAPHRAVLGLLAVAMGRPGYGGLIADLHESQPEQIAAIANQGYAQTILHSAFERMPELAAPLPRDLVIYFAEMQRANGARNASARAQLAQIAAILAPAGIPILALKGAADVLEPLHGNAAHRYISDLDLLIPAGQISQAARLLRQAKGLPDGAAETEPGPHHHLAQINHPDWPLTIELHLRPGSDVVARVLEPDAMLARAQDSALPGVLIPTIEDRFLHHILHGMELRHDTAALNLRLLADHVQYVGRLPESEQKQALTRLDAVGLAQWQRDLDALSGALMGRLPAPQSWAAEALYRFGDPEGAQARDTRYWIRRYARRLTTSGAYRRQILRKIFSPRAWAEFAQFHRERRNRFK